MHVEFELCHTNLSYKSGIILSWFINVINVLQQCARQTKRSNGREENGLHYAERKNKEKAGFFELETLHPWAENSKNRKGHFYRRLLDWIQNSFPLWNSLPVQDGKSVDIRCRFFGGFCTLHTLDTQKFSRKFFRRSRPYSLDHAKLTGGISGYSSSPRIIVSSLEV